MYVVRKCSISSTRSSSSSVIFAATKKPWPTLAIAASHTVVSCEAASGKGKLHHKAFAEAEMSDNHTAHKNVILNVHQVLDANLSVATLVSLLKLCGQSKALADGRIVHAHIKGCKSEGNLFLGNWVVRMYCECGSMKEARAVFDNLPYPNLYSWTMLMNGYAKNKCGKEALQCFDEMQLCGFKPNQISFVCALDACAGLGALKKGQQIHAAIVDGGYEGEVVVGTALVNMYGKCGSLADARSVFDRMPQRNVFSWSAMVAAFAQNGHGKEALNLFDLMQFEDIKPVHATYVSVLDACASLTDVVKGKELHAAIVERGFEKQVVVGTALVNMYGKCGNMEEARIVFRQMPTRNVISWNAMMAACAQNGHGKEALDLLKEMQYERIKPDRVTFICALDACTGLRSLKKGQELHATVLELGYEGHIAIQTALINMYGKCGSLTDARDVFCQMSHRNLLSWNAMIGAYAQNRRSTEALDLFNQMQHDGLKPNHVTYVCALDACSNLAALKKGKELHSAIMKSQYQEHIVVGNALINMYGKCGSLEDAKNVLKQMPHRNVISWSAMIAACAYNGHGKEALDLFYQMKYEGIKPNYVTFLSLLNACSHTGQVDEGRRYFGSMSQDHAITPNIEHYMCLIDTLSRAGHLKDAEDLIKAIPHENKATAWLSLLNACRIQGDVDRGERAAQNSFKLDPENSAAYILLSKIYAAAGRWDDAQRVAEFLKIATAKEKSGCCHSEV